ncbi:tetratricopeptide repeat protein [Colletotrichum asianum]
MSNEQGEQQRLCQLWEKSVIIWRRTLGESHAYTLEAKAKLGLTYSKLHEFTKALDQQESVHSHRARIYNKASKSRSAYLVPYLSSMGKLARLFGKTDQLNKALNMRIKAAKLAELHCGLRDPITFTAFNKLLNCEAALGHVTPEELSQKRQKLLSDQKRFLDSIHPSLLETVSFLAVDFETAGHGDMAIQLRRELFAAQKVSLGPENRETLSNMRRLALILTTEPISSRDKVREGVGLLEEIEAVQQRLLGSDNFQVQDTRTELSRIRSTSCLGEEARSRIPGVPGGERYFPQSISTSDFATTETNSGHFRRLDLEAGTDLTVPATQDETTYEDSEGSVSSFDGSVDHESSESYLSSLLPFSKRVSPFAAFTGGHKTYDYLRNANESITASFLVRTSLGSLGLRLQIYES